MGALTGAIAGVTKGMTAAKSSSALTADSPSDRGIVQTGPKPSLLRRVGEILGSGRGPIRVRKPSIGMNLTGGRR